MSVNEDQADCCPHCRKPFEIVSVKFGLSGCATIACCPNCALVSAERGDAESQIIDKEKKLAITRAFWQVAARMTESTNDRFWYVLALLIGALATAASMRHLIHTYGGVPREEIRAAALVAIPIVALATVFFLRKRQLRRKRQSATFRRG